MCNVDMFLETVHVESIIAKVNQYTVNILLFFVDKFRLDIVI